MVKIIRYGQEIHLTEDECREVSKAYRVRRDYKALCKFAKQKENLVGGFTKTTGMSVDELIYRTLQRLDSQYYDLDYVAQNTMLDIMMEALQ